MGSKIRWLDYHAGNCHDEPDTGSAGCSAGACVWSHVISPDTIEEQFMGAERERGFICRPLFACCVPLSKVILWRVNAQYWVVSSYSTDTHLESQIPCPRVGLHPSLAVVGKYGNSGYMANISQWGVPPPHPQCPWLASGTMRQWYRGELRWHISYVWYLSKLVSFLSEVIYEDDGTFS